MKQPTANKLPRLTEPEAKRDHIQGPPDASIQLLEYGDYECPYCGAAHPVVQALQREFGDRLCFAFRNFPLTNTHPHAEMAAECAESADAQKKFWEMHDMLFENQDALEPENLAEYAAAISLDIQRLLNELRDGTSALRVREDFTAGVHAGVNGTPTFFINGERFEGPDDFESMFAALNEAAPRAHRSP
jgi:protein-disulfide isomerase